MAVLFVYGCISMALFFTSRRNLFLFYSLYLFLLSIYIFDKNSYTFQIPANTFTKIFNWYIQVIYHVAYIWFSVSFVNYLTHYPGHRKVIKQYSYILLGLGSIMFVYTLITANVVLYIDYFTYIHVPLIILGIIYGIYKTLLVKEPMTSFYFPGLISYIIFSLSALYLTLYPDPSISFEPISYLYIGILIETSLFAIGIGYYTQQIYSKSLLVEKELNTAQNELREKLRLQLDQTELENTISKLKINSLQGQMNSHFIFNILNSIKTFIAENNQEAAINFLNKYAKLVREYLKGSDLETNDLEDEINTVKLYVELENMRLNNSLDFKLNISEELNLRSIKIPTHVLIPFIENSIWKGLFRQKEQKFLSLDIGKENNMVVIRIEDNGIYSAQESSRNNLNLVKSMQVAEKKIDTFNKSNEDKISYYHELKEDGGIQKLEVPIPSSFKIQI
ncbi:histidine kinase [Weeksellaceae bacterium KMM 9724]|nr:histidine kinase [Profundicola chukchiensis]